MTLQYSSPTLLEETPTGQYVRSLSEHKGPGVIQPLKVQGVHWVLAPVLNQQAQRI